MGSFTARFLDGVTLVSPGLCRHRVGACVGHGAGKRDPGRGRGSGAGCPGCRPHSLLLHTHLKGAYFKKIETHTEIQKE